jgi:glycosyltransferase involved in cell wall biosynthesis
MYDIFYYIMKILLVSTLKRKVTADETASRSQIIYQLGLGLAERGHKVSLLGTGDSKIPGVTTIPVIDKGWVDLEPTENPWFREIATLQMALEQMVAMQYDFDVIHNHTFPEFLPPVVSSQLKIPLITTLHLQPVDYIDELLAKYQSSVFVSISNAHKAGFKKAKIARVVHNGIDLSLHPLEEKKDNYLLWIGRISGAKNADGSYMDAKGVRHAIQLAKETGQQLILTGPVHDRRAFEADIVPFLDEKIRWIGKVAAEQPLSKQEIVKLMQKAKAFLMTINWEEPFGLVMAEAMSCGTPVIGFKRGAVPELVLHGKTGFVVDPKDGISGLQKALEKIDSIDPKDCREHVERNFSLEAMVTKYEKVYEEFIKGML